MNCSPPGFSVHGILQVRILKCLEAESDVGLIVDGAKIVILVLRVEIDEVDVDSFSFCCHCFQV